MSTPTLTVVVLAVVFVGWLDPHGTAREASRLYAEGKFDDAAGKYREALVDQPDSSLLHFNLGDTLYRQGKFADAVSALALTPGSDADPARTARVAYNVGNAKYRLGQAAEGSDPKAALGLYAEALAAYRRAMGSGPDDADAKFNHEFVEKKIADLKKKLEEQQKQEEPQQDQQQDQQNQNQEKQEQEKPEQEKQDEAAQDQPNQDQPQAQDQQQEKQDEAQQDQAKQNKGDEEQKQQPDVPPEQQAQQEQAQQQEPAQQEQQAGAAGTGKKKDGEMSKQEAAALLDAQRDQEVRPDEVVKRLQGEGIAGPVEDW